MRKILLLALLIPAMASAQWTHEVKVDAMTDVKSCRVIPIGHSMPYPMFFFHPGGFLIGIVGGDFPGKDQTFRVDGQKAESAPEGISGARAKRVLAQIKSGGKLLKTRSYAWPYDVGNDASFDLAGITEHLRACESEIR